MSIFDLLAGDLDAHEEIDIDDFATEVVAVLERLQETDTAKRTRAEWFKRLSESVSAFDDEGEEEEG